MRTHSIIAGAAGVLLATTALAAMTVTGDSNPNLAGREDGYSCCGGDMVPGQSPAEVTSVEFSSCDFVTFVVSGRVSFTPSVGSGDNPDGDSLFSMTNFGDGISAPTAIRTNALVGVFLGDDAPTGTATPERLTFPDSPSFTQLSPRIGQIFFVGDGRNTDSKLGQTGGAVQFFQVPNDATRLFLGTTDGSGWYNNGGSFTVDVGVLPDSSGQDCGDAAAPSGVTAGDALAVLRTAVGTASCVACVCDVDRSGAVAASDALTVLRRAVGQDASLRCECCPQSL